MKFLLRFWYLILLALMVSLLSAVGLLYLQREDWIQPPGEEEAPAGDPVPGMSDAYSGWNYDISSIEDLRVKMEAERENIRKERNRLEVLEKRVLSEVEELERVRDEITEIREAINADYVEIRESEKANLAQLAKVYTEMRPEAAVKILVDLDIELVVKILSGMNEEPASRILAEMSAAPEESRMRGMASRITQLMQQVKE
ncbi:MAG: hypothetical protein R6V45_00500 [Oceanipulchritudo sp.]